MRKLAYRENKIFMTGEVNPMPGWERVNDTTQCTTPDYFVPASLFPQPNETPMPGVVLLRNFLSVAEQFAFITECRSTLRAAPLFKPEMADGQPFRQMLSNCGEYGWCAGQSPFHDSSTYRYERTHPVTNQPWPAIPDLILARTAAALTALSLPPCQMQSCLLNYYPVATGRLGMHQDKSETDLTSPIITFSLGHSCVFKAGNSRDSGHSITINSGDVLIMHGAGRMAWHGVMKILPSQRIQPLEGRLSLTLRKVF